MCPICGKQDLLKLSEHLRQVHQLSCDERTSYLKSAVFSSGFSSPKMKQNRCMETKPYPNFQFKHPAMMMIVGPTLSGKSYFVEQLLNSKSIKYPSRKAKRIHPMSLSALRLTIGFFCFLAGGMWSSTFRLTDGFGCSIP